jgi:hypothetical protein
MHKFLFNEQTTTATPVDPNVKKLKDMEASGCLKNGKIFHSKSTGKFYYKSTSKSGKILKIYPDETYELIDPTTNKIIKTHKFNCDTANAAASSAASTNQQTATDIEREKTLGGWKERKDISATNAEISSLYEKHPKYDLYRLKATTQIGGGNTDEQKAFIKVWTDKGYKLNLTDDERASGLFKQYTIPGSEGIFPAPGLKMWASAESLNDSSLTTDLGNTVKGQTMEKDDCKTAIVQFYTAFTEKTTLPNSELVKEKVQRCKAKFYKKWSKLGIFDGGNKLDNMLDTLSGGKGGPSSYGADSKFRIQ